MGLLDSVTGFLDDNSSLLKLGAGLYTGYSQNQAEKKARENNARILQNEQDLNNKNQQALNEYNQWYQGQLNAAGAANSAASARNAAANAAAARQNEANRVKALKKSADIESKSYTAALQNLQPIRDAGVAVLPGMQKTYSQALEAMNGLLPQVMNPQAIQSMNTFVPATQVKLDLPDYLQGKK